MTYIPTIEELVEFNRTNALRKLELQDFYNPNGNERWNLFVDSSGRIIKAKPIGYPSYVKINKLEGNFTPEEFSRFSSDRAYHCFLERPYHTPSLGGLTTSELKIILGRDYIESIGLNTGTTPKEMNAMWKAIIDSPHGDVNAYLLGKEDYYHSKPDTIIVPVQYYHINPRRHRALRISQYNLDELLEEIKEERKGEDAKTGDKIK